jgi:ferritin-like metal-binding protein YciE
MQTGIDFLRDQVDDAIALHKALIESMSTHESDADDQRYRDLCIRHEPHMRQHQTMLERLRASLGTQSSTAPADVIGAMKKAAGTALGIARSFADTPQSDYMRLVGDLALVRQLEVTFRTFRDAGRQLGITQLAKLGEVAERHHDDYSAEAKRLLTQMFVERAKDAASIVKPMTESRADSLG